MTIKVRHFYGKLEEYVNNTDLRPMQYITGTDIGSNKIGLDTANRGAYRVGAINRVVEAGSDDSILVLTGHDIKVGDLIRIKTTANSILETEIGVGKIIDADTVQLDAVLSADLAAGDTFDILRFVMQRYAEDGSTLVTVSSSPIQFILDGVDQTVIEDTVTPANNAPLPVKLTGLTGDVNITAGDLHVQLEHTGANYDSTRIGDGTNLMAVNASLEAQVRDGDLNTTLTTLDGKVTACNTGAVVVSAPLPAGTNNIGDVDIVSSALPTGAATEVTLAALNTKVTACDTGAVVISAALPAGTNNIGDVDVLSSALPTGAATEAKQDTVILELQGIAGAQSITPVDFLDTGLVDSSSTNITVAGLQVVASLAAECFEIEIVDDIGSYMVLTDGSDVILAYLPLGGGRVKVNIPIATTLKLASLTGASITVGQIAINFLG